jgi:predicted ArsR family transcriptional regulator
MNQHNRNWRKIMRLMRPPEPSNYREKIYRYLSHRHRLGTTAETLARQLFISRGTVLRHLKTLIEQGRVTSYHHDCVGTCYRTTNPTER